MPNYDYQCKHCNHSLEAFQKITDEPLSLCPNCHKEGLERGVGGGSATFQFKGNGFYLTDYKNCGCASTNSCSNKKDSSNP